MSLEQKLEKISTNDAKNLITHLKIIILRRLIIVVVVEIIETTM